MRYTLVIIACFACSPALAEERTVWAEVSSVEPITEVQTLESECATRPNRSAGLDAVLAWDLSACRERRVTTTTGYRVRYRWGGREYSHITEHIPGHKIPIRVGVEPRY